MYRQYCYLSPYPILYTSLPVTISSKDKSQFSRQHSVLLYSEKKNDINELYTFSGATLPHNFLGFLLCYQIWPHFTRSRVCDVSSWHYEKSRNSRIESPLLAYCPYKISWRAGKCSEVEMDDKQTQNIMVISLDNFLSLRKKIR